MVPDEVYPVRFRRTEVVTRKFFVLRVIGSEGFLFCYKFFYIIPPQREAPLCKGSCQMPQVHLTEGLFYPKVNFYNPSASHSLGTSLYTREEKIHAQFLKMFYIL